MKRQEETQELTFEDMLLSEKTPNHKNPKHSPKPPSPITPAAQIGSITGLTHEGHPLVTWPGNTTAEQALTQIAVKADMVGKQCTLLFVGDEAKQPVILGLLHDNASSQHGYNIVQGEEALILQCGAARIELHDNGRIILQGMQIDSQAYGPYRIKGASVKVN